MQRINDEFTDLKVSKQRKYQLRRAREERCIICGEPVVHGARCLRHLIAAREMARKRLGLKRRFRHALSYRLAERKRQATRSRNGSRRRSARS